MIEIKVSLSEGREYPVLVGTNAREKLDSVLPKDSQRVAIITQDNIGVNLNLLLVIY